VFKGETNGKVSNGVKTVRFNNGSGLKKFLVYVNANAPSYKSFAYIQINISSCTAKMQNQLSIEIKYENF
jgi:hypothetical protein